MKFLLLCLALLGPVDALDVAVQAQVQAMRSPALEGPMKAASDIGKPAVLFGTCWPSRSHPAAGPVRHGSR